MRSRGGRSWRGVVVALVVASAAHRTGAEELDAPASAQPRTTFSMAAAATLFFPSAGLDLSWQPHERVALGLQATTLVVHLDLSLRARLYLAPGARGGGPYLGTNGHLWWSPLLMTGLAPAVTGELGWEWRGPTGVLAGVGAGGGRIRVPRGSGGGANPVHWEWIPLLDVRVGRAF